MLKTLKKFRLVAAIVLLIQACYSFILFLVLAVKNRSVAYAFLAMAGITGIAGGWMLSMHRLEEIAEQKDFHDLMRRYNDDCFDDDDIGDFSFDDDDDDVFDDDDDDDFCDRCKPHHDIPVDDTVDETEFDG